MKAEGNEKSSMEEVALFDLRVDHLKEQCRS